MSTEELIDDVDLSRAISEAEKAAFDARLAELQVQKQEYEILETQLNLKFQLDGVFNLDRKVDRKSMVRLFKDMRLCHMHNNTANWVLNVNSVGGDTLAATGNVEELLGEAINGGGNHNVWIAIAFIFYHIQANIVTINLKNIFI